MANAYGMNLGNVYKNIESIKGARTQNALSELNLSEQKRVIAERPEKERKERERQNMLTGLRGGSVAGDKSAQQQLLAVDPEGGAKFMEAVNSMDDRQLEAVKRSVDEMGKLSAFVVQGSTPEEQKRRYLTMRAGVAPDVQATLPKEYSPEFMQMSLTKSMAMDKILENPKSLSVGTEDVVYRQGQEIERASKPVTKTGSGSGSGGSGGTKSADESLMYRQSAELLGGIFDDAGNITNLDPQTRNKIQGIADLAVSLYNEGNISRTGAVKSAAKKFKFKVPSYNDKNPMEGKRITNDKTGEVMVMSNGKWVSVTK